MPVLAARDAAILPRQTHVAANGCLSVLTTFPTPPPTIQSELQKNPPVDPCNYSTPASLSSEFGSYSSQLASWATANQDKLGVCSAFAPAGALQACNKAGAGASATLGGSSAAASGATRPNDAAPRRDGMAMAAAAAVAAAGLVVAI
ncbi:hypothetical protein HIM_07830 [Hirsutella minnesotensis 3608]|uniref:Infection structure specific protein n=1 Tax=Hirsutella minnesotensis 3608 TaxID=1043627 RepID=A0A0F7ZMX4_9HYPO|nr:hypothetical protein HIM_07830 [Hirsutella minnesotensis 3608]